jgi:hypothetical protein
VAVVVRGLVAWLFGMHMQMQIAVTCYYITLLHTHSTPTVVLRIDGCSQSTFTWLAGELQLQFHMVNHADLFCVPLCPSIYHHDRDQHERQSVAPPTVGRLVAIKQKLGSGLDPPAWQR